MKIHEFPNKKSLVGHLTTIDQRNKGSSFNCDRKYKPRYFCQSLFMITAIVTVSSLYVALVGKADVGECQLFVPC